jgi:hypothetical protein
MPFQIRESGIRAMERQSRPCAEELFGQIFKTALSGCKKLCQEETF